MIPAAAREAAPREEERLAARARRARRSGEVAERGLRVAAIDWRRVHADLDAQGHARIPRLLAPEECRALAALYAQDALFRSTVSLERFRFGRGEYRYFARPLPAQVEGLRAALYPPLAAIANAWQERLGAPQRFERTLGAFLRRCHAAGQKRPTPLLLHYRAGDYNCLHQDLYGPLAFPLQLTALLAEPGRDFEGGEFLLVEQRPRQQSRGEAVALAQGEAIVFPTRERPVAGSRGVHRAVMRHGVSTLRRGERTTLGIIFHDAR
jgi:hypothetical protein